jgi:hypothetical protein
MSILSQELRQKIRSRSLVALTIVCLPCICVVGTCVLLSHALSSLKSYELPSTRRKKQAEYKERERRRYTPLVLPSRKERDVDALTISDGDHEEFTDAEAIEGGSDELVRRRGKKIE